MDASARAVNLASADITGTLPTGNQAAQTMIGDVVGTTAANAVTTITGSAGVVTVAANSFQFSASGGVSTISQTQATAGAGVETVIAPQTGHTPGTDLTGQLRIKIGPNNGTRTARVVLDDNGTDRGYLYADSGGARLVVLAGSGMGATFQADSGQGCSIVGGAVAITSSASATITSPDATIVDNLNSLSYFEYTRPTGGAHVLGLCIGGALSSTKMPSNSGDGVMFIGNCGTAPTANCDNTGVVVYANNAQLLAIDTRNVRSQVNHRGQVALPNAFVNVLRGCGAITYAVASTSGAIAQIKATDVDSISKKPCGTVTWTLTGFDPTKTANATFQYTACIRSTNGTGWAVQGTPTLLASQNDTTNTYSGNLTASGNDLNFTVTSNSTDSVIWTVIFEANLAAGTA